MTTRYCIKCQLIIEDNKSIVRSGKVFCRACQSQLIYFGRESANLSSQELLESYDAAHPFDPIGDYRGVYKNYGSIEDNVGFLECEDILKFDPTNKAALLYISKYHWGQQRFEQALYFLSECHKHHSFNQTDYIYFLQLLVSCKSFKQLIATLNQAKELLPPFIFKHYQAIAYLGLSQHKKALKCFYHSHQLCTEPKRKDKITTMIRRIHSFLDNTL